MTNGGDTTGRPQPLGDTDTHYWLAQRMAKAAGIDLVAATEAGALTQEDWARMVTRCRGCPDPEGCTRWLARGEDTPREVLEICENIDQFQALRKAAEEFEA